MNCAIVIGVLLLVFSGPAIEFYKNSKYANKLREKKRKSHPYNIKLTTLNESISNTIKINDWENEQFSRKSLLWLETIYEFEQSKKNNRKFNSTIDEDIICNFSNKDVIEPDTLNFIDPRHKLYAENAVIAFEQTISRSKGEELGFMYALNPNSANMPGTKNSNGTLSEQNLPYPKDFIMQALSFLYTSNTITSKKRQDFDHIDPQYFEELKSKLNEFN